jgi:hypothetical protein
MTSLAYLRAVDDEQSWRPEVEMFEALLDGWRTQQLSRNLAFGTINNGARIVRRFQEHAGSFPWDWTPTEFEIWAASLRAAKRAHSTVRSYEVSVRLFLAYVCDPAYGWDRACLERFGSHPIQICTDENLAVHATEYEGHPARRPLSRVECQALFDAADDRVDAIRANSRKGWMPAFRDATMLKVTYGWGLRRQEVVMLEVSDFGPNPHAPEFGAFGVCQVRFGKATNGSSPPAPRRPDNLGMVGRCPQRVGRRCVATDSPPRRGRPVAIRTRTPGEQGPVERSVRHRGEDSRTSRRAEPTLLEALARHPRHRRRV